MAKLSEILDAEKKRTEPLHFRQVHLWADGSFYRAYEYSAWLCVRYIKQFKVTRRAIKSVGTDMLFVGFPQTSLEKLLIDGVTVQDKDDKNRLLTLPQELVIPDNGSTLEEDFRNWRDTIPLSESKSLEEDKLKFKANPVSLTGIMKNILEFPVESSTPLDCLHFIVELKKQAASML